MLFDLDGVLADTEPLHWTAYREVLLELGVDVIITNRPGHVLRQVARSG